MQDDAEAGDRQPGKDDPAQVTLGLTGGAGNERREQDDADRIGDEYLERRTQRQQRRALLRRFVTHLDPSARSVPWGMRQF